jgi:peptidoglycan/LPS O-acetylase OafA/YrhL
MTRTGFWFRDGMGRLEDKSNNFTAMRIVFALMVLYGHAIVIPMGKPYVGAWGLTVDFVVQCALDGFFILSGYMITASAMKTTDISRYTASRFFRIFPGLIAAVLIVFAVYPFFTSLSQAEYWTSAETWTFPLVMIGQVDPLAGLPGTFENSPVGHSANGPLWTIRYELMAYLGVGILTVLGLYRNKWLVVLWAGLTCLAGALVLTFGYSGPGEATITTLARFGPAFMIGAFFFAARAHVRITPAFIALAGVAALAAHNLAIGWMVLDIFLASACLWLGHAHIRGRIGEAVRNVEDISYGLYILHWPIGLVAFALLPGLNTTQLALIMAPAAILAGWVLREAVEKPALAWKDTLQPRRTARVAAA